MVNYATERTKARPITSPVVGQLLQLFCAPHLMVEIMGDWHERYFLRVEKFGKAKARKQNLQGVLAFARPYTFKRRHLNIPYEFLLTRSEIAPCIKESQPFPADGIVAVN